MKIGFMGSAGTGKTTLMNACLKHPIFDEYSAQLSIARTVAAYDLPVNDKATPYSQLLLTVARCNMDLTNLNKNLISDRTPLDSLAYTMYSRASIWEHTIASGFYWEQSYTLVQHCMKAYDLLVYFPIFWKVVADDVRIDDPVYQKEIDTNMKIIVNDMGLKVYPIINGNIQQRVHWLADMI